MRRVDRPNVFDPYRQHFLRIVGPPAPSSKNLRQESEASRAPSRVTILLALEFGGPCAPPRLQML
jgi:hypothetical protein